MSGRAPLPPGPEGCPLPLEPERITLAHGAGAGASARLFEEHLRPRFANAFLDARHDGAVLPPPAGSLAFTTDTFVVQPLFFPGGDIGSLAVHGTLNDLAMCGAKPLALSCALVLEEGLEFDVLDRVVISLSRAAEAAGVPVVTGDTKVVERSRGDGLLVNTAGLGEVPPGRVLRPDAVVPSDVLIVSGPVGCHGAAVMAVRDGIALEGEIESDSDDLGPLVENLLEVVPETRCLRDPTRGGVAAVLHEIAGAAGAEVELEEAAVPVTVPVRAVCELLGLDPLSLASEGRLLAFVPEARAEAALDVLRAHALGRGAARVGRVLAGRARVVLRTTMGTRRLLPLPAGDPLPRIC